MPSSNDAERGGDEAFGRAFVSLMKRLAERYDHHVATYGTPDDAIRVRMHIGAGFAGELEGLIASHAVTASLANYARHVVREGYEVDFDQMDPTDEARRAGGERP